MNKNGTLIFLIFLIRVIRKISVPLNLPHVKFYVTF